VKRLVLDASYAASWFLPDELSTESERLLAEVQAGKLALCVPELWIYEMANLLRMAGKRKRLSPESVRDATLLLEEIPMERFSHAPSLMLRWLALAERHDLSAYDAAYLELAERLNLPLKTLDQKLRQAAKAEKLPVL
jgi:predicted nucleic acid-binding protein